MRPASSPSCSSWKLRSSSRGGRPRRLAWWWRGIGSLWLLLAGISLTSCASPVPPPAPRPVIPPGRPSASQDQRVVQILGHLELTQTPAGSGYWVAKADLVELLVNRLGWRTYALALEAAGDWRGNE